MTINEDLLERVEDACVQLTKSSWFKALNFDVRDYIKEVITDQLDKDWGRIDG